MSSEKSSSPRRLSLAALVRRSDTPPRLLLAFVVCAAALAACYVPNGAFKDKPCDDASDCPASQPICESNICVACTATDLGACMGDKPICRLANMELPNRCDACAAHTECPLSNACLPSGACASTDDVAYVTAGALGTTCTKASPCSTLAAGVATGRSYVLVTGTIIDNVTLADRKVTVLGSPGAKLTKLSTGPLLNITGASSDVSIYDLELTGAEGANGHGASLTGGNLRLERVRILTNDGLGVSAVNAGKLTIARSEVRGNLRGGLHINNTSFDITNSFITFNGASAAMVGGVLLERIASSGNRFAHNTLTRNTILDAQPSGVSCSLVASPIDLSHNILWNNSTAGGSPQAAGINCRFMNSIAGPNAVSGLTNMDPLFASSSDFHLTDLSPARNAGPALPGLTVDFDGDPRPGAGNDAVDFGADEIK